MPDLIRAVLGATIVVLGGSGLAGVSGAAESAPADTQEQVWEGRLATGPGTTLRSVLHVTTSETGVRTALLDSPDQSVSGMRVNTIALDDRRLTFDVQLISGKFEGKLNAAGTRAEGRWLQGAANLPLNLARRGIAASVISPDGEAEFQSLFNGRDLTGWNSVGAGGERAVWSVEEGNIVTSGRRKCWLTTDRDYDDFELRLEYRVFERANSGVLIRGTLLCIDPKQAGMEIQIADDESFPNLPPLHSTGAIYDVVPRSRHATRPPGEWNAMRIVANGSWITVVVNGVQVVDADLREYKQQYAFIPSMERSGGRIGLQSWDGRVEFRNVAVRPLSGRERSNGAARPPRPMLVLESGGHTGSAGCVFTPDGREVISVSADSTIRFWSVETGQTTRILRPLLTPGGRVGPGALSPDGKMLAVMRAGIVPTENWLYLIALPEGRVTSAFRAGAGLCRSLRFSPDGERLVWTLDAIACVYLVGTRVLERDLRGHKAAIHGLAFSPDGRLLATSSGDETARIWNLETGETQSILEDKERRCFTLNSISIAADGRTIGTTSWGDQVRLWNLDGTLRERIPFVAGVACFTADPNRLLLCSEKSSFVIDITNGKRSPAFTLHKNAVWGCSLSPDGKFAATAGAAGDNLFIWNTADGKIVHHLIGKGRPIWGVGWSRDGHRIAWGHSGGWSTFGKEHPLEKTFDLRTLSLEGRPDEPFERFRKSQGSHSLRLDGMHGTVTLVQGGADGPTIRADNMGGVGAFTFVPDGRVALSNTTLQSLEVFDARTGKPSIKFNVASSFRELSVSPDDQFLLSGSSDEIVRIWSLDRADPVLSLFFAGDDWVAWTPEGYYAASPGGEQLMGWQVNNGSFAMGSFYPASQFRKTLYRPDVIKRLLGAGSLEKALAEADAAAGQRSQRTDVAQAIPPNVAITSPARSKVQLNLKTLNVEAVARSVGTNPVTEMRLLLDGRPLPNAIKTVRSPVLGEVRANWTVEVFPGSQRLTVQASSAVSKGVSEPLDVAGVGDDSKATGRLYLLVVGINDYLFLGKRFKLDSTVPDARSIHQSFQNLSRPLFRSVESRLLLDGQATRANVLASLQWLKQSTRPGDKAVVFYAGHGDNQITGQFYILPVDAKLDDFRGTGISDDDLKKSIGELPCSTVLMLDACYSGSFDQKKRKTRSLAQPSDALAGSMVNDYGLAILCAANNIQEAIEDNGHGLFTQALTQGLAGEADFDKDGVVELYELLPFVKSRVTKLSAGDQVPRVGIPQSIESFPMSKP